jgi:hypothetical protein
MHEFVDLHHGVSRLLNIAKGFFYIERRVRLIMSWGSILKSFLHSALQQIN